MDDSVTLAYSLSERDWRRAVRARQHQLRLWRRQVISAAVAAAGATWLATTATAGCGCGSRRAWFLLGTWVTTFALFLGIFRLSSIAPLKRLLKANPDLLGPIEVRLTAAGVYESKPLLETFRPWQAFADWRDGHEFAFLYLGSGAYGQFITLPTAHAAPEQWQRAREVLVSRLGPPKA